MLFAYQLCYLPEGSALPKGDNLADIKKHVKIFISLCNV